MACEFGMDTSDLSVQRASRRKASLSKDRAAYTKRNSLSPCTNRKASAAPVGSDFATPHRAARAATRTCLAKGMLDTSSDMPQISMGRAGAWRRWIQKPSVSATLNSQPIWDDNVCQRFAPAEGTLEDLRELQMEVEEEGRMMIEQVRLKALEKAEELALGKGGLALDEGITSADEDDTFESNVVGLAEASDAETPLSTLSNAGYHPPPPFFVCLDDEEVFPSLVPEKSKLSSKTSEDSRTVDSNKENVVEHAENELSADWIYVTPDVINSAQASCLEVFPKNTKAKRSSQEPIIGIDWSLISSEVKSQLINTDLDACSSVSVSAKRQASRESLRAMREVNICSSKRQASIPKSPRCHSKPRASRQASKGR